MLIGLLYRVMETLSYVIFVFDLHICQHPHCSAKHINCLPVRACTNLIFDQGMQADFYMLRHEAKTKAPLY